MVGSCGNGWAGQVALVCCLGEWLPAVVGWAAEELRQEEFLHLVPEFCIGPLRETSRQNPGELCCESSSLHFGTCRVGSVAAVRVATSNGPPTNFDRVQSLLSIPEKIPKIP